MMEKTKDNITTRCNKVILLAEVIKHLEFFFVGIVTVRLFFIHDVIIYWDYTANLTVNKTVNCDIILYFIIKAETEFSLKLYKKKNEIFMFFFNFQNPTTNK